MSELNLFLLKRIKKFEMAFLEAVMLAGLTSLVRGQICVGDGVFNSQFGKCYHFFSSPQPLFSSARVCDGIGGQLISIHSAFEKSFVLDKAREVFEIDDFWIGLADFDVARIFSWFDGSPLTYTNWENGYPQSTTPSTDCVASRLNNGQWYNTDCDKKKFFVCTVDPYLKSVTVGDKSCAGKGTFYNDSQVCFYFVDSLQNYVDASKTCRSFDGFLVTLESEPKQKIVAGLARQKFEDSYWIGLNDMEDDGQWQWDNWPSVTYVKWEKGYPVSDSNKSCVLAEVVNGNWKNTNCDTEEHVFVCETQPKSGVSPAPFAGEWDYFAPTKSWYLPLYNSTWSWNQYEDYCVSLGAHLTSIHSLLESHYIFGLGVSVDFVYSVAVFIGLKSKSSNLGTFMWTDGSPVDYANWYSGYPSGAKYCAANYEWSWYNYDCNTATNGAGVCKKSQN